MGRTELLSLGSLDTGSLVLSLSPRRHHRIQRRITHCSLTSKCFSKYLFFLYSYVGSLIYKHMLWNEVINSRRAGWFSSGLCYSRGDFLGSGQEGLGMW